MSNTYIQDGKRLTYANAGSAISSGDVVVIVSGSSGFVGIAVTDIAATTGTGQVEVEGVHELAKKSGDSFTFGNVIYWDSSNLYLTTTSSGNTRAGRVAETAGSSATTAKVKINQN